MRAAIIAFSESGMRLGERISAYLLEKGGEATLTRCPDGGLAGWTSEHFLIADALLFIGSCGIAVRAIAPHIKSKSRDAAVLVIDDMGHYVIPVLSGHIGGANRLSLDLAAFLNAQAVITTATDIHSVFAVDDWAVQNGLFIENSGAVKRIASRLLCDLSVTLRTEFAVLGPLPKGIVLSEKDQACEIDITWRKREESALTLVAPVVTLGVGSRRGISVDAVEYAFSSILDQSGCHPSAIKQVCSIDLKAEEPGILEFCSRHALPYRTFSAQQLMHTPGEFSASDFVEAVTGADNVCERSAISGSGEGSRLLAGKTAFDGVTMALAIEPYTVCFEGTA